MEEDGRRRRRRGEGEEEKKNKVRGGEFPVFSGLLMLLVVPRKLIPSIVTACQN
jgi:hypothetical protein